MLHQPKVLRAMLAKLVRDVIAGQLTVRLGMLNVHVNGQWNVVAADAATKEAMRTLLVPTTIYGIEVSPRELSSSSTGITVVDSITITAQAVFSLETPVPASAVDCSQGVCSVSAFLGAQATPAKVIHGGKMR